MSEIKDPPAGWTLSQFRAVCAEVGSWTWGTVQGAFNEKASITQIIVDAVIGMIPLVGDATAVRDLIAVIIGLSNDEEKRNSKWEWVLLVVLLFALIPVFGGVVKGVGRIVIKVAKEAAVLTGAAKVAHLRNGAKEVIEFLNRIGVKNAEKWLLALRIADHSAEIIGKFKYVIITIDKILLASKGKVAKLLSLSKTIDGLRAGLARVLAKGNEMIPIAVKELDQQLRDMQAYIRSGGETTSRLALHEVATGQKVTTRADERRLVEGGVLPARTNRGGFRQNPASHDNLPKMAENYKHEIGYPDLTYGGYDTGTRIYNNIAAFSGKMINRQLKDGEEIFRFFGPGRTTHGFADEESSASGAWWGVGKPPKTAKEWREFAAVLDSFNGDGFYVTAKVVGPNGPKAVVGTVSEQLGDKIPGQYLPGGATQAFFLNSEFNATLQKMGQDYMTGESTVNKVSDLNTGLEFTIHSTGWTDANGIWGYINAPGITTTQTARVATREQISKDNKEVSLRP
jgi:hypothetical protein